MNEIRAVISTIAYKIANERSDNCRGDHDGHVLPPTVCGRCLAEDIRYTLEDIWVEGYRAGAIDMRKRAVSVADDESDANMKMARDRGSDRCLREEAALCATRIADEIWSISSEPEEDGDA